MELAILGPNLPIRNSETFHVHAVGCRDLLKAHYRGQEREDGDFNSRKDVAVFIYDPGSFEYDPEEDWELDPYIGDFKFFDCVGELAYA